MSGQTTHSPSKSRVEHLRRISPRAAESFRELRKSAMQSGPLDARTCELILLGSFATAGSEAGFKTHARGLLGEGVPVEILHQAVTLTLGATTTLVEAVTALEWIDDVARERA